MWVKAKACEGAGGDGVGGGYKGVGAELQIEHGALRALRQYAAPLLQGIVNIVLSVDKGELAELG